MTGTAAIVDSIDATYARVLATVIPAVQNYVHTRSPFDQIEDLIVAYITWRIFKRVLDLVYGYGPLRVLKDTAAQVGAGASRRFLELPYVRDQVESEMGKVHEELESTVIKKAPGIDYSVVPEKGLSDRQLKTRLDKLAKMDAVDWEDGKVSGAVYLGNEHIAKLQAQVYQQFCFSNQLHPDAFPGVRQMEAEVVSMCLRLFHAPDESGCGTTTSGGTESLLLAALAAREKGRAEKGIVEPEIVAPRSIHAAIFKAAKYFRMNLKLVDLTEDGVADMNQYKRLITNNTVLLLGSAPNFPYGTIDNIQQISNLAVKYNIPLHVDCCLGSFIVAYYEKAFGKPLAPFDFQLAGVTSISCDTHKYGFTPKGSSVIMYRSQAYRKYQYYVTTDWIGGLYGSPTLAGSRPGALSAGTWATMLSLGDEGYTKSCHDIVTAAQKMRTAIEKEIPALQVIGKPDVSVVAFKSDTVGIYPLTDAMSKKGWHLSALQQPSAAHLCVTALTVPVMDNFIADLKETVDQLIADGDTGTETGTAQLYGTASSIQTNSVAGRIVEAFIDALYQN